jgi:hypothetical protein
MNPYIRPARNAQKWTEQKEKLLLQFKNITDKDLFFEAGRKHEMIMRVSLKLGKTEEEMERIFQAL